MNVGPDGSLYRITSSAKGIVNNVKIVQVSDNKTLNTDEPKYKLVFIGEEENANESLSEESDGEAFEKEVFLHTNVKQSTENNEKDKAVKVQKDIQESKPEKEKFHKRTSNGRFRSKNKHGGPKNYKSFSKRNFNSSGNIPKPYNRSKTNTCSQDIDPWIRPPLNLIVQQYGMFQQYPSSAEPILNNSVTPGKTIGLLGDAPSSHYHHCNFPSSYQSTQYRHNPNFGKGNYSSSYQNGQNRQGSSPSLNYQIEHWKNINKPEFWKRNENESQQDRRNKKSYYSYRK